jgi:hypothetical protein
MRQLEQLLLDARIRSVTIIIASFNERVPARRYIASRRTHANPFSQIRQKFCRHKVAYYSG